MNYDPMGGISNVLVPSAAQESKDSQPDPPIATTSSSSTASSLIPVPLGTLVPNMWPQEIPESVKTTFHNWENTMFTEFKDHLKAYYRRKTTIWSLKDHLLYKTFPPDLGHKFIPFQNLPHSIHEELREIHRAAELSIFQSAKQSILESRIDLLQGDLANVKSTLTRLLERSLLRDNLLSTSPSLNPFMHQFDAHFTAFLHRVEILRTTEESKYNRYVEGVTATSLAAAAARTAATSLSATANMIDTDVVMSEDAAGLSTSSSSKASAPPGRVVRAATAAPPPAAAAAAAKTSRVTVTPAAPAAAAAATAVDSGTIAALQATLIKLTAKVDSLSTGAASSAAPARARATNAAQKGPKNSSGPGGKSTTQTSRKDGRSDRPLPKASRKEDRYDRRSPSHDRRSIRSPSRQPSRSDSSRYKRQPSPSRDRDDDRGRSSSRPRTSRRSPSPPPRRGHWDHRDDRDQDRGRSQRREYSNRA